MNNISGVPHGQVDTMTVQGNPPVMSKAAGRCQSACQLVLSVGALIVAMFAILMWNGYNAARREALASVNNIVDTLSARVRDDLGRTESDCREFARQIISMNLLDASRTTSERGQDLIALMVVHLNEFRAVRDFRVYDAEGREVIRTQASAADVWSDVSGSNWFAAIKRDPAREVGISHVEEDLGRRTRTLALGVPIRGEDGGFRGSVAALIDLGTFQDEIDGLSIGGNGLVMIRRTDDYRLVLRRPEEDSRLNTAPLSGGLRDVILSGKAGGDGDFVSPYDNITRTYAFRNLGRIPLAVTVAFEKDEYLKPWRQQMAISAAVTLVLTLAMLVLFRRYHIEQDRMTRHALRYQALMNTATDGIHILDENGDLVEASASFYRMLGYDPENPPPLNVADWDARFTREEIQDRLKNLMQGGRSVFETCHRRVGNSMIDVEITAIPIILGNRYLLYNSSRDISARKRAEMDMQASALRLNQVLDTVAEGIIGIDEERRVMFANPSAVQMLGYGTAKEVQGKRIDDVTGHRLANHGPCSSGWCRIIAAIDSGGTVRVADEFFTNVVGETFAVEYVVTPLATGGKTLGAIIAFHDISARMALEAELRRSNAELEQFAYVASHDLRQPLRMITSYLELIEDRIEQHLDAETRRFFEFVTSGAKKLDVMIINLLELSRIGRNSEPFVPVSLETVVYDAVESLRIAIDETGGTVAKTTKLPTINGNSNELVRLFQNLIGNAVKYRSPDRKLAVEIGAREEGGGWVVWVRDNGIGIPTEFHDRIFLIFQRLVSSSQIDGTGIGLAICQKIIQHHGGKIWVESDGENGATFFVSFPSHTPV